MSDFHYTLGLDIGIGSVGWAVLRNDPNGEPDRIKSLGVRVFDKVDSSSAAPRREARSTRRRLRRHRHRLERIRRLMEKSGIMSVEDIQAMYAAGGFGTSPYELRAEALDRPLTKEETVRVLIHLAQRRGYRANSTAKETAEAAKNEKEAGKMKEAIEANHLCMEQHGYRTVGEMMFRDERFWQTGRDDKTKYLQTRNKADNYRSAVRREDIEDEAGKIFAAQRKLGVEWMSKSLEEEYLSILESQRSFDEGPGGDSPFRGGIGEKVGRCTLEPGEHRAAKATYTFEYFRLLQDLNNMSLAGKSMPRQPLDKDQREILKAEALRSASISYARIRKKLKLAGDVFFTGLHYGDKSKEEAEKREWKQLQAYHRMKAALDKLGKGAIDSLTESQLNDIATILTENRSDEKRVNALREKGIPPELDEALLPLSFSGYGNLSVKAMQKLIPYMERGMRYDEACKEAYGDHRGQHAGERKERLYLNDMEDIANPVVRRAVSQTIKVVNAVVRTWGPPDVVRIELAREMKQNEEERRETEKRQEKNRKANEEARKQVEEYKHDRATGLDIVKFKLWQEQKQEQDGVCVCMYSGQNLDISRLFEPGYAEVDHIAPYSRSFDDSYQNKVLVLTEENRKKGNRLPYDYFGQDEERWSEYETRVEKLIRSYRKRQRLLKKTLTDAESKDFKDRNLKDTQYITRAIHGLLKDHLRFAESKCCEKVQAVNGAVTAMLRGRWGLQKIREDGDLHHCMDAAVIAATTPGLVQRLTEYNERRETLYWPPNVDRTTGESVEAKTGEKCEKDMFPAPWERFREELEARLDPVNPKAEIDRLKLATYESDEEIRPIFVSRAQNHKITGAAHKETIRSSKKGDGFTVTKTPLNKLKLNKSGEIEGYGSLEGCEKIVCYGKSDRLLYDALLARLKEFGGDGKKAFAEAFYKPKSDGTPGPRVDKVKIIEKATTGLPVRGGIAANGDMVRIDVFRMEGKGGGYYFVPIYVADTKKAELPDRAAVAHRDYAEWREMKEEDFLFSLYKDDLVRIQSSRGIKLNLAKGGTGEKQIVRQDGMYYFSGADISGGAISLSTHDRRYEGRGVGIKTLQSIEKYQVDVLGNYYRVKTPEKRMKFSGKD